ncbi:uncharacterized protein LOC134247709 [Saccostrea cucullata]|uniref:uncharacterized protein LOC134247709 n=1 Tax=Saccostrea cuccullata TaxID=36930 RepID=UPI002ED5A950
MSVGNTLQSNTGNSMRWYIKTKALKKGWPITDDVWVGVIKGENNNKWYEIRRNGNCDEKTNEIPGLNQYERQCGVLNMSAVFDILLKIKMLVNISFPGFQFYPMSNVVEKGSERKFFNVLTEIDCATSSFTKFECYAATYFHEEKICVAKCTDQEIPAIPDTVSLVSSTTNSTVLTIKQQPIPCIVGAFTLQQSSITSSQMNSGESTLSQALDETTTFVNMTTIHQTSEDTITTENPNEGIGVDTEIEAEVTTMQVDTITQTTNLSTIQAQSGCVCICSTNQVDITQEMLKQKVTYIKKNLTVNRTLLSSTKRKKTSASDDRQSSVAMGTLGGCVIIGVILTFVVCDLVHVVSFPLCAMNNYAMFSRIVLGMVYVIPNLQSGFYLVWSVEITRPAYHGTAWSFDYIVFSEHKTWLEAVDVCGSIKGYIQFKKYANANWYIRTKAEKKGWFVSDDVWIGLIKEQYSDLWYEVRSNCPERKGIAGEKFEERQCAVLNMSAVSSSDKSLIYASPCDERNFGFVCLQSLGPIPQDVESYPNTEIAEERYISFQWNVSSESECARNSFTRFLCYAATYFPDDKYCVAECTELNHIKDTVSLVNSSKNSTVLLRTHSKVFINHTKSTFVSSSSKYPCITEPTIESTEASTSTTQTSGGSSTTAQYSEDTSVSVSSTENYSECFHICSNNEHVNITTPVLNQKVLDIKRILTLNKTFLSSTVRKKTSAADDRQSSLAMGTLGIIVIFGVIIAIISGDLVYVVKFVKFICPCILHNKKKMSVVHD